MESKNRFGFKSKLATGIAIGLMLLVMVLEWTVLRGDQIAQMTIRLSAKEAGIIKVEQPGQTHLVEIDTRRGRKSKGKRINMRLEDPDGAVIYESSELASRKERFFSFTPKVAGPYKLHLELGMLSGSSRSASVRVFVNDRRVLARIMAALPF